MIAKAVGLGRRSTLRRRKIEVNIYPRVLASLMKRGLITDKDTILVAAGGETDRQAMIDTGLRSVTISNLDFQDGQTDYAPYEWKRLDVEKLDLPDNSYDWVVIHAGLHHIAVPALGVCEMFRVARKGILCYEARDSLLMKIAVAVGLTPDYEMEHAFLTNGSNGGYRNGPIPNYVYRWTEREFEKVINCYAPTHRHTFFYYYGFRYPVGRFSMIKNPVHRFVGLLISKLMRVAEIIIPKQGNQFAFGALKNKSLQPWLNNELGFNRSYLSNKYDKEKFKSG
jgi:SAM-dependent methyltransferase